MAAEGSLASHDKNEIFFSHTFFEVFFRLSLFQFITLLNITVTCPENFKATRSQDFSAGGKPKKQYNNKNNENKHIYKIIDKCQVDE